MNLFIDEDTQLRVKRGIYWLDKYHPKWESRINLDKLKMNNCSNCVIGQAVGDYYSTIGNGEEWAIEHGFQTPNFPNEDTGYCDIVKEDAYYSNLETLWSDEVSKRLG